jgi:hypothetical protein
VRVQGRRFGDLVGLAASLVLGAGAGYAVWRFGGFGCVVGFGCGCRVGGLVGLTWWIFFWCRCRVGTQVAGGSGGL